MLFKQLLRIKMFISFFAVIATTCCFAQSASTDTEQKRGAAPKSSYRFSYTPTYQFDTDLDSGGQFDVQRHLLRFDTVRSIDKQWSVGLGLSFDYEHWNFTNRADLPSVDLWDAIYRPGMSIPVFYAPAGNWRFGIIPSIDFAGASGAGTSESFSYGTVLSAAYSFSPQLMLGLGAGWFERLGESKLFPYVVINWKINEQFRLTNPFRAGPVGPAGLELVYTPTTNWEVGTGGAYRSYRFRLDDSSTVSDGIAEVEFWAPFIRAGRKIGKHYRVDIHGGVMVDGSITIENEDGNEIGETDYETAPFLGITLKGRF